MKLLFLLLFPLPAICQQVKTKEIFIQAKLDTALQKRLSGFDSAISKATAVGYSEVTRAYTATANDNVINATSGTFTIAVNNSVRMKPLSILNTGSGVITVSGATFDGQNSILIYPGHGIELQQTPTGFTTKSKY